MQSVLRVPLAGKLAGANAVIVLAGLLAAFADHRVRGGDWRLLVILAVALSAGLAVNLLLIVVALRPLRALGDASRRIWQGDYAVPVPPSPIADTNLTELARTLNLLITTLSHDRSRARQLASEVIRLGDLERSRVSRELHESLAQSLAALLYHLAAAESMERSQEGRVRLVAAREIAEAAIQDMGRLSRSVHPRVVDDRGLLAGLTHLARATSNGVPSISVTLDGSAPSDVRKLPAAIAATFYRVAEEALGNAMRYASATSITISVGADAGEARMEITDDGVGFDTRAETPGSHVTGLFLMRERIALAGGHVTVTSSPGSGTSIRVRAPLPQDHLERTPPTAVPDHEVTHVG